MFSFRALGTKVVPVLALVALLSAVSLAQTRPAADACFRVRIESPKPLWISSATFVEHLSKIALVDPLRNSVLLVSPEGKTDLLDASRFKIPEKSMTPAFLIRSAAGYTLTMVDQGRFWLDAELNPAKPPRAKVSTRSDGKVISLYDSVAARDSFYSFGAVKANAGQFRFGFFRSPLFAPTSVDYRRDVSDDDYLNYYLLGHKYLTGLNGDGYAVWMSDVPEIVRFPRTGKKRFVPLTAFPEEYHRAEKLQTVSTSAEQELFAEIEKLTIPVGLYGQDGLLYLLTRKPRENGEGTLWLLHQINPNRREGGEVLGQIELPTTANHLTVINTGGNWFVFEKGPVQSLGEQKIESMLVIPHSSIQSRTVPKACPTR